MARFTFGTFIADDANRDAFRACQEVATRKRASQVPLFILGDEGCGKTHLLYSIVNRVKSGNRAFLNLLTADWIAVERLRKLGSWCRQLERSRYANPYAPARNLLRGASEVNRVFRTRFKRLSLEDDLPNLGNLLLVAGTAAASEHFKQPAPVEVTARLSNADPASDDCELILQNTIRVKTPWS